MKDISDFKDMHSFSTSVYVPGNIFQQSSEESRPKKRGFRRNRISDRDGIEIMGEFFFFFRIHETEIHDLIKSIMKQELPQFLYFFPFRIEDRLEVTERRQLERYFFISVKPCDFLDKIGFSLDVDAKMGNLDPPNPRLLILHLESKIRKDFFDEVVIDLDTEKRGHAMIAKHNGFGFSRFGINIHHALVNLSAKLRE